MIKEFRSLTNAGLMLLILGLIAVNLAVTYFFNLEISRIAHLCSLLVLIGYYLFKKQIKNRLVTLALLLYIFKDIFFQFYEQPFGLKNYMIFGCLACMVLVIERLPNFKWRSIKFFSVIVTGLLALANTFILRTIMDILDFEFRDSYEVVLFYGYGALMMILGVVAVSYNHKFNSNRSLLYIFMAFGFIFCDIATLFAYYFEFEIFYFFDRIFFLLGAGLLVDYGLNFENAKEEIYQYRYIDKNS